MFIIFMILGAICLFAFPTLRCALSHPVLLLRNAAVDTYTYFKHKQFNFCRTGELVAYVGLFGRGKTLSVVHRVVSDYHRYDGKLVWCSRRKKLVTQRVKVLSNVTLQIPYEQFISLEQIVLCAEQNAKLDDLNDTLTVTLVLGDEFSVQMNSRNFKTNIDPLFLNTLLTCRHYHISIFYTSQRFGHVDALLRQVTSAVVDCNKFWRFQRLNYFDAWEMENATSASLLRPYRRGCWFVRNRDYAAYDTFACVGNLKKSVKDGDMMSAEEILSLQQNTTVGVEGIVHPSRKLSRRTKKTK